MTPEQKARLRNASLCRIPRSAGPVMRVFSKSRKNVDKALRGGSIQQGLAGAVFIEACNEADRYIVVPKGHG